MIFKIKAFSFLFLLVAFSVSLEAQTVITVGKDQSICEIARQYLGDADLWEEILKANNVPSPDKVSEGLKLTIPVEQVKAVNLILNDAMGSIKSATEAGAKSFATDKINAAVASYEQGVKTRKNAQWSEATRLGKEAKALALEAEKEAKAKSQTATEAVLNYIKGVVEGKLSGAELWKNLAINSKLFEEDKVRTLSGSYAEILFNDKSRIKLNENSQVLIQKTRVDLLKNKSEATVKLEKGDAFALLSGGKGKKNFNFNIPGVKADIKSKSFWVKREEKNTKIANYEGEIEVESKTKKVKIAENQGSTVSDNGNISDPKDLLPAPLITHPKNQQVFYSPELALNWSTVEGTVNYLVQIATEQNFKDIAYTAKSKTTSLSGVKLGAGNYFIRIASEDKDGFIGPFSDFVFCNLTVDVTPPFITISSPADSLITNKPEVELKSRFEKGAIISLNGEPLNLAYGTEEFSRMLPLKEGANPFVVEAKDSSNNVSSVRITVFHEDDLSSTITLVDPVLNQANEISVSMKSFTLRGKTRPLAKVNLVYSGDNRTLRTKSDSEGGFVFNVLNVNSGEELILQVETRTGYKLEKKVKVLIP